MTSFNAGGVFHDGRLIEQHERRRRRMLGLPLENRTFAVTEVDDERADVGWRPCGIKANE
jgi:hypothetical protein